jgi:hypothetical protein
MQPITSETVPDELNLQLGPDPKGARPILLEAIAQLVSRHIIAERSRCRGLCKRRAELWRNTKGGLSLLAEEARARANEADYLADLISNDEH